MLKAYKFRMYPNKIQKEMVAKHIGCCRYIYNYSLDKKIKTYQTDKKSITQFDLNKLIPELKNEFEWLKEVNSQSLQQSNNHLDSAFKKFFREKNGFPKFKSKHNNIQSFTVPQHYKVDVNNNKIFLPKIGLVKVILHRKMNGTFKTATVSKTNTNKYYISILVDDGKNMPTQQSFNFNTTVGIDMGLTHLAILSTGEKIDNHKYLKNNMIKLKMLQRLASRKIKKSMNRKKSNLKVSRLYEKIRNQRTDYIHKFTYKIVGENQAIAIETLNVKGMLKNHNLAQSISDVSWSEGFRQLEYKCNWSGKTLLKIGMFEPSTKICNICGNTNHNLTLNDRTWICEECNTEHDRDINAALNIKKIALQTQNLIGIAPKGLRVEPLETSTVVGSMN